jgi:hypothetical protein
MANTTNYNWETPDDTDLVKDGAAAIRTLGNSIDTTTKNLNPETTTGDIAYRSATANTNTRLAIGSTGQVLTVAAGVPSWATPTDQTPLTSKGDVFTFSTVDARLGVGANGTVLTADSAETTGLKWAAPAAGGGVTLLSTTSLSGVTTTISSISQDYNHLLVIAKNCFTSGADSIAMRLDGDSGSNYYYSGLLVTTTTLSAYNSNAATQFPTMYAPENVTGRLGQAEIWLYNYTSTSNHYFLVRGFSGNGSTNKSSISLQGYQVSSSAIDSISFNGNADTCTGTIFIYGVK